MPLKMKMKKKRKLSLVVSIRRDPIHVCGRTVSSVDRAESVPDPDESELSPTCIPTHCISIAIFLRKFKLSAGTKTPEVIYSPSIMGNGFTVTSCVVQDASSGRMKPTVLMSVELKDEMRWAVTILNSTFSVDNFSVTNSLPPKLSTAVSDVLNLISLLDITKFCIGNPEFSMVEQWHQKIYTMHSYNGKLHVS